MKKIKKLIRSSLTIEVPIKDVLIKSICTHRHCSDTDNNQYPYCSMYGDDKCSVIWDEVENIYAKIYKVLLENKLMEVLG